MGEPWLMGAELIGLPVRHRVSCWGVDQRSIAARKRVRESYTGRLLTAAGDVFGNLILTQRNSLIGQPQKWTGSSRGSRTTAVETGVNSSRLQVEGGGPTSTFAFPIRVRPNQKCIKILMWTSHKYLRLKKSSQCTITPPPQKWCWRNQTGRYS